MFKMEKCCKTPCCQEIVKPKKHFSFGGVFTRAEPVDADRYFKVFDEVPDFDYYVDDVYIDQVIYRNPATVVFWNDGTKTVSKCSGSDVYSPETGLAVCVLKKLASPTKVHDLFKDWLPEQLPGTDPDANGTVISVADVRRKYRNNK